MAREVEVGREVEAGREEVTAREGTNNRVPTGSRREGGVGGARLGRPHTGAATHGGSAGADRIGHGRAGYVALD